MTIRTSADHELGIPDLTIDTGSLRRNTQVVEEDLVARTDADFGEVVPDLATVAWVGHAVQVGPDGGGRTLARPGVLVPDGSSLTVLNDGAELVVPLSAGLADAGSGAWVPHFAVGTENTSPAIPVEPRRTVALQTGVIPLLSAAAGFLDDASSSIPGLAIRADAHLVVLVEDSAS